MVALKEAGKIWKIETITLLWQIKHIRYLNNEYVIVGYPHNIAISSDGENWEIKNVDYGVEDITYGNGIWVIACENGYIGYSTNNMSTWSYVRNGTANWKSAGFCNGKFILGGYRTGKLISSTNGSSWSDEFSTGTTATFLDIATDGTTLLATTTEFDIISFYNNTWSTIITNFKTQGVCHGNNMWIVVGEDGYIATLDSELQFIQSTQVDSDVDWQGVCYGDDKWVVVGKKMTQGCTVYSKNGSNWSNVEIIDQQIGLNFVIYATDKFIATGDDYSHLLYSYKDGVPYLLTTKSQNIEKKYILACKDETPKLVSKPSGITWTNIAYGKDKYVMIGNNYYGYYTISSDLSTWSTPVQETSASVMFDILYAQGKFVMCGLLGSVGYSYDGEHWTFGTCFERDPSYYNWRNLSYAPNVVNDGIFYRAGIWHMITDGSSAYSYDGINWSLMHQSIEPRSMVVYSNNKCVAKYSDSQIISSTNGTNWDIVYQNTNTVIVNIVYGNNKFVAGGWSDPTGRGIVYPITLVSTDGDNWTPYTQNIQGDKIKNIQFYDNKFVASYYNSVNKISTDGINWTNDADAVMPSYICGTKLVISNDNDNIYSIIETAPKFYV